MSIVDIKPKVVVEMLHDYEFKVSFPDASDASLIMDEPALPFGDWKGRTHRECSPRP